MARTDSEARSLNQVIADINKTQGEGAVIKGSQIIWERIPRITTGSLVFDIALGGGWPANQWHEIVGHQSSGKTAIVMQTIAANQRLDPNFTTWWLAAETFDIPYALMNGVDVERVLVHDTNVMEAGMERILQVSKTREVDCIVIDSYPALVPIEEDDKQSGESSPGRGARVSNQFWRKQGSATRRSLVIEERPITGFMINQWREQIGVMHGDPRISPGGKGKNFAAYTQVDVRRGDWHKSGTEPYGQEIHVTTMKNKSHRPRRTAKMTYYFADAEGKKAGTYDLNEEVVLAAISYGVLIPAAGSWLTYGDLKLNGRPGWIKAIEEDPSLRDKIHAEVMAVASRGNERKAPKAKK